MRGGNKYKILFNVSEKLKKVVDDIECIPDDYKIVVTSNNIYFELKIASKIKE